MRVVNDGRVSNATAVVLEPVGAQVAVKRLFGELLLRLGRISLSQHTQQPAPLVFELGCMRFNLHAVFKRSSTGGDRTWPARHLYETQSALTARRETLVVAKCGYPNPNRLQTVKDRHPRGKLMFLMVD
jgi:hypothetical protein